MGLLPTNCRLSAGVTTAKGFSGDMRLLEEFVKRSKGNRFAYRDL